MSAPALDEDRASALDELYSRAIDAALAAAGDEVPTLSPRPRLPASIGASILQAEQLAGAESRPLRTYYLETVPRQYVEQRLLHLLAGRAVELPSHGRTRCGRVRIRSPLAELAEVGA